MWECHVTSYPGKIRQHEQEIEACMVCQETSTSRNMRWYVGFQLKYAFNKYIARKSFSEACGLSPHFRSRISVLMIKVTTTKLIFGGHQLFFVGPLILLFWTLCEVCPRFQSQGASRCLCASLPLCNGILKFTSSATPADFLKASMAAEPFPNKLIMTSIKINADNESGNEKFPGNVTHIIIISWLINVRR